MKTIHRTKSGQFFELDNGITERQLAPEGVGIMRGVILGCIIWLIIGFIIIKWIL